MDKEKELIKEIRGLIKKFQNDLPEEKRLEVFHQIIYLTGLLTRKNRHNI
ncbi:hypothetical protein [Bacillus sp. Marseille-Q3570]|nr:hypothetical protein [Bacillus sp. Marseille-Q3570]